MIRAVGNLSQKRALKDTGSAARKASYDANMVQKNRRIRSVQLQLKRVAAQATKISA